LWVRLFFYLIPATPDVPAISPNQPDIIEINWLKASHFRKSKTIPWTRTNGFHEVCRFMSSRGIVKSCVSETGASCRNNDLAVEKRTPVATFGIRSNP